MEGYGKRVLVVEDDESMRLFLVTLIEWAGYNVIAVGDGLDAVVEIKRRRFDVVVTDLSMPILNGVELLGYVHTEHPDLPVILLSGDLPDHVTPEKGAVFFACLRKPFENPVLLELVGAAVRLQDEAWAGRL